MVKGDTREVDYESINQFETMTVTSDEVVRILGSLNIEEVENVLDEIRFWRRSTSMRTEINSSHLYISPSRDMVVGKLARISHCIKEMFTFRSK